MPAGHSRLIRAVAYYRKSNEDDGNSIEQQREWAHDVCPKEDIVLVREFSDQAKRGWETAKRTEFHEMLDFCRQQARQGTPVDTILCWNANRFSRADSQETSWFIWEFRQAGVGRMLTATRWVDFSRMEDRVLFNIEQDTSHHPYVVNLARDSTRGRITAARGARYNGGGIPYGYRLALGPDGKPLLVLGPAQEVETVRWIFHTYANTDKGVRAIAEELTRRGVPTATGLRHWSQSTVRDILSNPAYLGRVVWNRRRGGKFFAVVDCRVTPRQEAGGGRRNPPEAWIPGGDHEPIVDVETFERCQAKKSRRRGGKRPGKADYLLTGLLRCGHCGSAMSGRPCVLRQGGKVYRYRRYTCGGNSRGGKAVCEANGIDADALARAVLRKLRERWLNPETLDALRAEIRRQDQAERGASPARLEDVRARLRAAERKAALAAGRVLEEEDEALLPRLRQQLKELVQQCDLLAAEAEALERQPTPAAELEAGVDAAVAMMGRLEVALREDDAAELRAVLQETVAYVELWFDHRPYGKRTRSLFARGLIFRRADLVLDSSSGRGTRVARSGSASTTRSATAWAHERASS
jgi:DNA invertase Pin-like site-specific DNA recombinase